jgi:hypothetical protein
VSLAETIAGDMSAAIMNTRTFTEERRIVGVQAASHGPELLPRNQAIAIKQFHIADGDRAHLSLEPIG